MRVFVTVGSTRFDRLVHAVLDARTLDVLRELGYTDVVVQCGNMRFDDDNQGPPDAPYPSHGCTVQIYRFKPSLDTDYDAADLIISHAGSGTVLDVLRRSKPLVAIANTALLDNHQQELADALADLGHIKTVRDLAVIDELTQAIREASRPGGIVPFPAFDGERFRSVLDREMGYSDGI